jgi:hypothetical protein
MTEQVTSGSAYGNQYTISRQGVVDAITGNQWLGIIKNYQFVINQISKRVRWQGTMDFAVDVVTGVSSRGLLPSMAWQYAYNDSGEWVHSASSEQATGFDLNGQEPDLGFHINLASDGSVSNYGQTVWIDPRPTERSFKKKPQRTHDLASIIMHETLHAMGIAYDINGESFSNAFKRATVYKSGKPYFTGENAVRVYGGDVPISDLSDSSTHDHVKVVNKRNNLITVMADAGSYDISWRKPAELDYAILKDIGWNVI